MDTARELFEKEGHYRVSLPEIARKMGVVHSTLYLYFKDRDALLAAVCQEAAGRGRGVVDQAIDPNSRAPERLRGVVIGNLGMAYDPALRWNLGHLLSLYYFSSFEPQLMKVQREITQASEARIETIIAHGNHESAWSVPDTRAAARTIHNILFAESMKAFIDAHSLSCKERIEASWKALLEVLGPPPSKKKGGRAR